MVRRLTREGLARLVRSEVRRLRESGDESGLVNVNVRVEIDATDMIDELGIETATEMCAREISKHTEEIVDILMQDVTEIDKFPVAVRDAIVN
jgi:hypothetical protein